MLIVKEGKNNRMSRKAGRYNTTVYKSFSKTSSWLSDLKDQLCVAQLLWFSNFGKKKAEVTSFLLRFSGCFGLKYTLMGKNYHSLQLGREMISTLSQAILLNKNGYSHNNAPSSDCIFQGKQGKQRATLFHETSPLWAAPWERGAC